MKWLNRLCKWRSVFAGWQLGTRPKGEPESDAVRDHREVTLILRAETSALVNLLIEKKVFSESEYKNQLEAEAQHLSESLEKRFPGFKATDYGLEADVKLAAETTKNWKP